ncbi:TPA: glucans biosynthesis glucosyltransferase MdoH [Escherichia coli]
MMKMRWLSAAVMLTLYTSSSWAFSIDDVAKQAQSLAGKGYEAPKSNLPSVFRDMKYADYQQIQFNHDKAYWNNLKTPFKLEFYHQGMYFDTPVKINEVTATAVKRIKYSPDYFTFGDVQHDKDTVKDLGFAGFKVLYPINSKDKNDEIVSMLGASYFRVIGAGQVYGLSARGLAIDTALPSGEEFPRFKEFWIERPKPTDKRLTIYALLDSPRATGAYKFVVMPGRDTVVDVQSKIYLRDKVGKLGVAPLTSMFLFGPNQPSPANNYRPELHDSNGLSIHAGNGEWIWRPLNNPKHLAVSSFSMENPQGFGLLQRGRDFSRFEDLDDRYDLRPSAWVTPKGEWGKGSVELVEIPTNDETNDNIVAYWTPDQLPEPGKEMNFKYTITFSRDEDKLHAPDNAWVQQTRRSTGDVKQSNLIRQPDGTIILSHDFVEAALMRRAGWGVWIAYDLPGSYEELPPNLLDELKRDRRWCHGNLMNFRLFLVKGMHPVHRAVFLTGVMSYLSAPLWFMFLALSTALQVVHALTEPQYFLQPRQLFPVWPQWRPELAIALFASTMVLLFLPKLLSILLIWCKGTKEYGGFWRVTLSLLLEVLFSVLLAPVRMLFHTVFVVSAFLGWEVVWNSPQRDDDSTSWGEAFKRHGSQLLLGLVWAVGMAWLDLRFLFWLAPIVFSLILSPFVSVISSRATVGLRTKRWKLFLIPEEYSPPQVLVDTDRFLEMNRQRSLDDGFMHAVFNPSFNALATAMATARHRASKVLEIARDRHVEQALNETPEKLNRDRRLVLLSDPVTMARLHFRVWNSPERYSSWVSYYEGIKLNPLALRKPDAASQ